MDVSELFTAPPPKSDPTKNPVVSDLAESNGGPGKRNRLSDDLNKSSPEPVDTKRPRIASKGKQRAEESFEYSQTWNGEEDEEGGRFFGDGLTSEQKEIIDILNHDTEDQNNAPPETGAGAEKIKLTEIKKNCLNLERAINKNRDMRTKFEAQPEKFVDSEFELSEGIVNLSVLTQCSAQSYPELNRLGTLGSLVGLLSHENVDIAIAVVELLQELTDDDVLENQEDEQTLEDAEDSSKPQAAEAVMDMVRSLIDQQLIEMLISTLVDRLNENEEAERSGVFHCLGLIENLISLEPSLSVSFVQKTPLLKYLMNRIRPSKPPSSTSSQTEDMESLKFQNKQYASEILAIILQKDEENRKQLIELGGMDTLLEVLAVYRKRDPNDADEIEFMENIFDSLCSVLLVPDHKVKFLEGEGVELMIILMKRKNLAKYRALKVLDHALSGDEGSANCEKFVDCLGLKTLFSFFMGKKNSKKSTSTHDDDEHMLGIIVSLFFNLASDSQLRLRLLTKFVEESYEKVDRLVEIREGFRVRVDHFVANAPFLENEMDETEIYLMKLDAGLFALQLTDVVIAWLCMEDDGVRDHLKMLLKRSDQDFGTITDELKVYADSMGDGPRKEGIEHLITYSESLL
ncbi:hypothetical protein MJO29_005869 [Puccinia striiformis f. sp. tritici]|uniref:Beta-catenin-like protein 1 N-terminal domain-containing protein n=1 Tax=Puccinia striiformis f. sp. tritici PST-78 TaxID=1165861 RepID=A0A0L0V514_9BASI|nr:hypothetical protein Pst134EA_011066 [Puccinia striiformis f. sp. tritici]KAI9628319.1 hypothetical protein H4Q26_018084 [Puccinia striiformis f. sp. tritici PST-130]KNE94367.1 hypothetical protein PSTG_12268 [Puccinia striiformis f. sp. tritici PST-78]KAH9467421.1 hypothetical protein Pst134EA_011066 [Puccinia striiformis f. sp. tritici]KAI7957615.1 hypothetical protein MJO29_005832 [Puccinia striiformis f. sp. tritici]KAI7957652.1 hypothetical protein MJO29_005869 [Puccinia striiformis f.